MKKFVKIKSLKKVSTEKVYDISLEQDHSFFANKICIHNCSGPNLQQMPKQGVYAKDFRKLFKQPEDYYIAEADYSGFQLRIAAIYSKDPIMVELFNKNGDMHSITANSVFCRGMDIQTFLQLKGEEPYKSYRYKAKCFIKGTKIVTTRGSKYVEDFIPELNKGFFTPTLDGDIQVLDRFHNKKNIHSTYFGYTNETIQIELENGDIIEVTPDHKFPIIRNNKEIKIKAEELLDTDEIIDV